MLIYRRRRFIEGNDSIMYENNDESNGFVIKYIFPQNNANTDIFLDVAKLIRVFYASSMTVGRKECDCSWKTNEIGPHTLSHYRRDAVVALATNNR